MNNLILISLFIMTGLSVVFAAILAFADKKLKVADDPRVGAILSKLPGLNCGACGFTSCHAYAEHIVKEHGDPGKCRILDDEARKELFKLAGRDGSHADKRIPLVHCAAEWQHKAGKTEYKGVMTCSAAKLVFGGGMACEYGCIGLGDCCKVCPFGALSMRDGLPRLDKEKCTGCAKCAGACPRKIISLEKKKDHSLVYVACSSHDDALRVRKICPVGCIACGICVKLSPEGFFRMEDNLSVADHSKHTDLGKLKTIAAKCPTKVIKEIS